MRSDLVRAPALALLLCSLLEVSALSAQPSEPPSATDDEPEPVPVPAAADLLGGHPLLGLSGKLVLPFGELDDERSFGDRAGVGYGVAGDLGIGLSRSVELGVWGDYARYADDDDCPDCETTSFGVGPYLRYHLVQGMRFDPYLLLGVGYRSLTTSNQAFDETDAGLAWLKLALGGTWYALSQVGFGPYLELELATITDPPRGADPAVLGTFAAGLRLQLDFVGR